MNATVRMAKPFVFNDPIIKKTFNLKPGQIVFGPKEIKWKDVKRIMKHGFVYSYGFGPMYFEIPSRYLELTIK